MLNPTWLMLSVGMLLLGLLGLFLLFVKSVVWVGTGRRWPYWKKRSGLFAGLAVTGFVFTLVFGVLAMTPLAKAATASVAQGFNSALQVNTTTALAAAPNATSTNVPTKSVIVPTATMVPAATAVPTFTVVTIEMDLPEEWEVKPNDQWTLSDAESARAAEWAKLKGPATKLVVDQQLGDEAPSVTEDGIYGLFTGHGKFSFGTLSVTWPYERGTLYIALFENDTVEPLQFFGADFPTGGTSLIEYREGSVANIQALARLPLVAKSHCGVDCQKVVVVDFRHTENGDTKTDYSFNRVGGVVNKPTFSTPVASIAVTSTMASSSETQSNADICGSAFTKDWNTTSPSFPAMVGREIVVTSDPAIVNGVEYTTRVVIVSQNSVQLENVAIGNEGHANAYGCSVMGTITMERVNSLQAQMSGSQIVDLR